MPNLLKDVLLDEVSLVGDPANQHARVILYKMRKDGGCDTCSGDESMCDGGSCPDAALKMRFLLKNATADQVAEIMKRAEELVKAKEIPMTGENKDVITKAAMDEAISKAVADALAKSAAATQTAVDTAVAKAKTESDAAIAAVKKDAADAITKAAADTKAATEALAKEKEAREDSERLTKAKDITKDLPNTKAEDVAKVLKSMPDQASADLYIATLKSSAEAAKLVELTKERGSNGGSNSRAGTAYEKAEKMASELVSKDSKMTKDGALSKVWNDNPQLYEQYEQERRRAN